MDDPGFAQTGVGARELGCEFDKSLPTGAKIKNGWFYISSLFVCFYIEHRHTF